MGIQKWGIFFVAADWQRLFFPVGVGHDKENPVLPSFSSSIIQSFRILTVSLEAALAWAHVADLCISAAVLLIKGFLRFHGYTSKSYLEVS